MLRVATVVAATALALTAACGGKSTETADNEPQIVDNPSPASSTTSEPTDTATSTTTSQTATPTPTPTATAEPELPGVGEKVQVDSKKVAYEVSVLQLDFGVTTSNKYEKPQEGNSYYGMLAQWCLDRNDYRGDLSVSEYPWSLHFQDGTVVKRSRRLSDASVSPPYPSDQVIPVGTCGKGWIVFEGRASATPNVAVYAADTGRAIVFNLKK